MLTVAKKTTNRELAETLSIRAGEYLDQAQSLEASTPPLQPDYPDEKKKLALPSRAK